MNLGMDLSVIFRRSLAELSGIPLFYSDQSFTLVHLPLLLRLNIHIYGSAVKLIIDHLDNRENSGAHIYVNTKVVERRSCIPLVSSPEE
ncbi:hypothetical protein ACFTRD_14390 [Paenibacillus sp. NPDC056933]|uniref:hypothetical protein n=1 Tax=Paenibacillus sp. NPDC056933 TaxID=3345968 RepID=UPI00363B3C8D